MLTSLDAGDPFSAVALSSKKYGKSRRTVGTGIVDAERSFRRLQSLDDLRRAAGEELDGGAVPPPAAAAPASLEEMEEGATPDPRLPAELTPSKKQFLLGEAAKNDGVLFQRFISEMDKAGIPQQEVEVRFSDLRVEAQVFAGDRGIPTLTNTVRDVFEMLTNKLHITKSAKRTLTILQDVSGVLKPGRMTLLLGPPGSGKSSLLKALAGCLDDTLKLSGDITYNGWRPDEFFVERVAAYVSQNDEHLPMLTVRETLQYACAWQGGKREAGEIKELLRKYRAGELGTDSSTKPDPLIIGLLNELGKGDAEGFTAELMMMHFGLDVCADTLVGDDMLRGISGGQKKRVTTSELIVGPKKTLFLDEISTGLDSATTFSIIKALGHFAHIVKGTVLVSLLQPAPETFDLFDDIMFLSDGMIAYHGPREGMLEFFAAQGFACPPRKGTADFLQEVTSPKDQSNYWTGAGQHSWVPVQAIADAFDKSPAGVARAEALAMPVDREAGNCKAPLAFENYALPPLESSRINMDRELLLLKRTQFLMYFRAFQIGFMAVIVAFLFFRTELDTTDVNDGNLLFGLHFFTLLTILMNALSEMVLTIEILPVFYKQRDMLFYPGWSFAMPGTISRLPFSVLMAGIWSCIVYYMVGYSPNPARFFAYMFELFLVHCMSVALFRLLGAIGRTQVVAASIGVLILMVMSLSSGYILVYSAIPGWWIWMFWISPLMYAQRALAVNEFTSSQWNTVYEYGTYPGQTIGQFILESHDFPTERYWTWIGFATLFVFVILFNAILFVAFSYLSAYKGSAPSVSEDALAALEERRTGGKQGAAATYRLASSDKLQAKQQQQEQQPPIVVSLGSHQAGGMPAAKDGLPAGAVNGMLDRATPVDTALEMTKDGTEAAAAAAPGTHVSTLPFEPMGMSFKDVDYFVPKRSDDKSAAGELQLLHGMSGCFRPGRLTALMGSSGAGKTTLMDVLAGRKTGGRIEGAVTVGGHPKQQATFSRVAGYVEQFDVHSPLMTVRESLLFSGHLRLPREVESGAAEAFVGEVMELVEMEALAGSLVGLPGESGLSVEQRKRLTIAVELCANPAIVFMDEPTSGLDARAAAIVMRVVRRTVDTQRTVVCTIHQPSLEIFEAFDELLLLKRGGHTIYNGPLGRGSSLLVSYFEGAHPGVARYHEKQNPANWMLDVSNTSEEVRLGLDWGERWAGSDLNKELRGLVEREMLPPEGSQPLAFDDVYATTYLKQTKMLMWRLNKVYWRMPEYNLLRMIVSAIMACIVGTWFWDKGQNYDTQISISNIMGALFLCVLFLGITTANMCMPVISTEKNVFYRERAANTYAPLPYGVTIHLIEFPYLVVQSMLYSLIAYFMIRFAYDAAKFFWFWWYTFLSLMSFTYFGIMQVSLTPNLQFAGILGVFFYALWNLFAGFFVPKPQMPPWMAWYWYLNPVTWSLYGLIESQLGDLDDKYISIPGVPAPGVSIAAYISEAFGYQRVYVWLACLIMLAFIGFWAAVSCAALKYLNYQNR